MNSETGGSEWNRMMELFDRLVESNNPETLLAEEHDPQIRLAALRLLRHHRAAHHEQFLEGAIDFELLPVFHVGQVLLGRFEVQRGLGRGGMGEVYLAFDRMLGEAVALKTITRGLAASETLRLRFVTEVQSARRVTHPNVCRIHELFQDSEIPFFSMEFLDGQPFTTYLKTAAAKDPARKELVLQLADGLHAAHQNGVVHGDFKPGNIMVVGGKPLRAVITDFGLAQVLGTGARSRGEGEPLQGGTFDYMAPELRRGSPCSVASDIYAFGKVARLLLPELHIWDSCTKEDPTVRPKSLKYVIDRLRTDVTRRYWLGSAAAITAGAVYYGVHSATKRTVSIPAGARILLNGFRSAADKVATARLVRSLMMTALIESARIRTIADLDLLPALRHLQAEAGLPVEGPLLHQLLSELRASYWVDANLTAADNRHSLELQVLRAPVGELVAEITFRDAPNVILLAQQAALWLRRMTGESQQSLTANPVTVVSQSSPVPEALESYYNAMDHYAFGEMAQVVPLLKEAVRLDPKFAQAHSVLGMAMMPSGRYDEAFQEVERAMQLANRLPERERTWIEANYFTLEEDPVQMVEMARRNLAYFPDEPRFCRVLAHTLCRSGNAPSSIPYSRKAVELAPTGMLTRVDLIQNLCEAGMFAEGLTEYEAALSDSQLNRSATGGRANRNNWIYEAGGFAYLGLERYPEAKDAFQKVPGDRERIIDQQGVSVMQGRFDAAQAALQEYRAGAAEVDQAFQANEFLCGIGALTAQRSLARTSLAEMTNLPPFPPMAKLLDCTLFWAFRLADDQAVAKTNAQLLHIAAQWPNSFTRAAELHGKALAAWRAQSLDEAERLLLQSCGSAFSIWALFDLAEFFTQTKPHLAESYWNRLDEHRGTILERWFPGSLVLAWLGRAQAAYKTGNRQIASLYSQKVIDHWSPSNPNLAAVRAAAQINTASKALRG